MAKKRRSLEAEGLSEGGLTHNPFAAALGGVRPAAEQPEEDTSGAAARGLPGEQPSRGQGPLLLRREVKGTGGHPVCRVLGLPPSVDRAELAREASRSLGCRVQAAEDGLVVGLRDPERVEAFLTRRGFTVRRAN